jgi:hypothetical protein
LNWDSLLNWIAATAAVGTAAMGLVEALKVLSLPQGVSLGTLGLGKVKRHLGAPALAALAKVYGPDAGSTLLEGAWRKGSKELETMLGNGLRMAVFSELDDLGGFFEAFGQNREEISAAVKRLRQGEAAGPGAMDPASARERVARLEAAIDARVEAAVASGVDAYASGMRFAASVLAIVGCVLVASSDVIPTAHRPSWGQAFLIGILSVPIAPIAKDVVGFLNSLRGTFERRAAGA